MNGSSEYLYFSNGGGNEIKFFVSSLDRCQLPSCFFLSLSSSFVKALGGAEAERA